MARGLPPVAQHAEGLHAAAGIREQDVAHLGRVANLGEAEQDLGRLGLREPAERVHLEEVVERPVVLVGGAVRAGAGANHHRHRLGGEHLAQLPLHVVVEAIEDQVHVVDQQEQAATVGIGPLEQRRPRLALAPGLGEPAQALDVVVNRVSASGPRPRSSSASESESRQLSQKSESRATLYCSSRKTSGIQVELNASSS